MNQHCLTLALTLHPEATMGKPSGGPTRHARQAAVLLLPLLGACMGYKSIGFEPGTNGPRALPGVIRVVTRDDRTHELADGAVDGDSIVGVARANHALRAAFALKDVSRVEVRHLQVWKTVGATVGVTALLAGVAYTIFIAVYPDCVLCGWEGPLVGALTPP
jgi:hypothetical protein